MQGIQQAKALLHDQFGFGHLREGQEPVISRLLAGKSVLAVFPTGAGKSICYQLPALMIEGVTLVISPLIALMKDQIDFLKSRGVAAERLDSSLELPELKRVMNDLREGRVKLLYVAPERLASERFLQTLRRLKIGMLAVDEAHCISEWGHNFRPDYMKLAALAKDLGVARVLGLTATATASVAQDIARSFTIDPADVIRTGFERTNLELRVTPVEAHRREALLLDRIKSRPAGPTIVYVTLQKTAEDVARHLSAHGLDARPYHAGMSAEDRHATQDWFMASDRAIVVATIAFGMGIDKRDIRYVYHYNLPKTLENYAQEIGRAGRDAKPSICETLACAADRVTLENFTYGDTPGASAVGNMLAELLGMGDTFDVSIYELSGKFDIRPLVVETVLTYLELEGVIASTGPFYNEYKYQPTRSSREMLAQFDPERRAFLSAIFSCSEMGKTWLKLDLTKVMKKTGSDRARIVAALNFLEERGELRLEVAGARQGYRLLRRDFDLKEMATRMSQRFDHREKRDLERIEQVVNFVSSDGCRWQTLMHYFGETKDTACNHCDVCAGQLAAPVAEGSPHQVSDEHRQTIRQLRQEKHPALATPRQMARFLCGINSPATTRAKLTRIIHPSRCATGLRVV